MGCVKGSQAQPDLETWPDLVSAYRERLVRRAASAATITLEMRALRGFTTALARRGCRRVAQLTPDHLVAFGAWLATRRVQHGQRRGKPWSPLSVLTWTNVVRRFLRWAARAEHTLLDWSLWIAPVKAPRTLPRVLTAGEMTRLLATASGTKPRDVRDRAVLELLYASGLRVGELVALVLADLDLRDGEVRVRHGKGGHERRVPIGPPAIRAVTRYLERARGHASVQRAGLPSPAVFLSRTGRRFAVQDVEMMVRRRAREADLGRVTPHALRHTAAVHLLRGGADVRHIQVFLGHACVGTTARYTQLNVEDLRRALDRAHPRSRLALPEPA